MDIAVAGDLIEAPPRFPDRLRLPLAFDPVRLCGDLEGLSRSDWIRHFITQNYDGEWDVLPLRGPADATHPVMMIYSNPTADRFADTPILARAPYLREVLSSFACTLHAVRLMRLTPGSVIKTHCDHDLGHEDGAVRIHIPIVTDPAVEFLLNGTPVKMSPGEAWYLRLSDPHSVHNRSRIDRVHLVIDAPVGDWITDLLLRAACA